MDTEDRINSLEKKVEQLEQKLDSNQKAIQNENNNLFKILDILEIVLKALAKMKTPASKFVVIASMAICTLINQLPIILPYLASLYLNK